MPDTENIFHGCLPALMTPCRADRTPDYDSLVRTKAIPNTNFISTRRTG